MKTKHSPRYGYWIIAASVTLLLLAVATLPLISQAAPPPSPEQIIRNAWELAQESGRYHFATDIEQTTYPAPKLANVGRSSHKDQVYLEGQANLPDRSLTMSLWTGQGHALDPQDTVEIRIEDDRAYGRQRQDAPWQEVDDFSGAFAPDGDLLAYLAGARNISKIGSSDPELGIHYSQYAFDLDGPAFARYVRDQLSDQLRRSGELPPGITLNTSRKYQEVTGNGEVWIDGDGLPLRLTVRLEYPPQENGEQVVADITTDFSNFDRAALVSSRDQVFPNNLVSSLGLPRTPDDWRQLGYQAGLMAGFVILMLLLVTHGRSKQVYAAFVLAIILSMLVTPLLQSQQVYAFSQRQEAEQAAYEERQAEVDATREMREDLTTSDWNPHADPLAEAQTYQEETLSSATLSAPLSPANTATTTTVPDPASDADHDGLTYIQEQRLGTDPNDVDTDGDQITDYAEVRGFQLGSQRWYGNPLDADTNKDTLADTQECWATMPPTLPANTACNLDTDSDGTPDLFDRDNDNDGVDDRVDTSPFSKIGSGAHFTRANPFQLQVNGFTAGEPLFVDFQLRPANADHLAYALNVLDWPSGDTAGQVQRVKDTTFADDLTAAQRAADPSNANGDMRLIPMLEIEIPYQSGHYGNLPVKPGASSRGPTTPVDNWLDRSKMAVHSISVRRINAEGALGVYVPINIVYDELGAGRSAFSARMPYFPTMANWGGNHQVRLAWVVQMKTDYCRASGAPTDTAQLKSWCAQPQNREERIQIVHTYYDDWYLTGLAVREDSGMDVAIAFEDPATDSNLNKDDNLWKLANGLGKAFITGRSSNRVARDITINEIRARFDRQSNGSIPNSDNRLWNIPKTALRVQTYSFEHEDFIAHVPMTYTKQILQNHFTSYGSPRADAPTLLIAREERARTATLDMSREVMSVNGRVLAVNLSDTHTPVSTLASVAWKPYRYRSGAWQPYPIQEYWDRLDVQLRETIFAGTTDLTLQDGQVIAAQCYYHSLFHGLNNVVQSGSTALYNTSAAEQDDDDDITGWIKFGGNVFKAAVKDVGEELANNAPDGDSTPNTPQARRQAALKDLGGASRRGALEAQSRVGRMAKYKARARSTGAVLLTVGLFVAGAASGDDNNTAEQIEKGLKVVEAVQELVTTVKDIRAATQGVSGFANKMNAVSKTFTRAATKIAVIGVIIAAGVAFGVFIAQMVDQGVSFGSLAFNAALAKTIAEVVAGAILVAITLYSYRGTDHRRGDRGH